MKKGEDTGTGRFIASTEYPPLDEKQVPLYEQLIDANITDPEKRGDAMVALAKRDRRALDKIMYG